MVERVETQFYFLEGGQVGDGSSVYYECGGGGNGGRGGNGGNGGNGGRQNGILGNTGGKGGIGGEGGLGGEGEIGYIDDEENIHTIRDWGKGQRGQSPVDKGPPEEDPNRAVGGEAGDGEAGGSGDAGGSIRTIK